MEKKNKLCKSYIKEYVESFYRNRWDKKSYEHVKRVAEIVTKSPLYPYYAKETQDYLYCLALAHDILEDSWAESEERYQESLNDLTTFGLFKVDLQALTRVRLSNEENEQEDYDHYVSRCLKNSVARVIKEADIVDHLQQSKTLTLKLRQKYNGVANLFMPIQDHWQV